MRTHTLKTWPSFFEAVRDGRKGFELRKNDRDFAVGDLLVLREFEPPSNNYRDGSYTGRSLTAVVTYITHGGRFKKRGVK